jgi:AAA ATPase domain
MPAARQIEIPSKIKSIYLELPEYQFQHGVAQNFDYFVGRGRMRDRLRSILLNAHFGAGGAYLITGYRGMGKTSLVEFVINEINRDKKGDADPDKFIKIHISLSQDDIKDFDVLKFFTSQMLRAWEELNLQLAKKMGMPQTQPTMMWSVWKEISRQFTVDTGASSGRSALTVLANKIESHLLYLNERLNSIVKTKLGNNEAMPDNSKTYRNKEIIRSESLPKEIEKELIYILNLLHEIRKALQGKLEIPQFLFIVDELDKIEPSYLYDLDQNHTNQPTQIELDNVFGINKVRRRQEVVARLLVHKLYFVGIGSQNNRQSKVYAPYKDVRNKRPDFRLQTVCCKNIVIWHLISNFSRLPYRTGRLYFLRHLPLASIRYAPCCP